MIINNPFKGIICPIVTPFDSVGGVNHQVFTEHMEWLISKNVTCFMVAGTTGEGMLLSISERLTLLEQAIDIIKGRAKIIAHVGAMTTEEAKYLTKHATELSVDGISAITPYFFEYSEEEAYQYYRVIAENAPNIPVSLYSFPGNAKHDISSKLLSRLVKDYSNIVAIKSSNPNLMRFSEYVDSVPKSVSVLCGVDALTLPALSLGSKGQVSGNSNIFPEVFQKLFEAFYIGNLEEARNYQKQINMIRSVLKDSIAYFKAAIEILGLPIGSPRSPILSLTCEQKSILQNELFAIKEKFAL